MLIEYEVNFAEARIMRLVQVQNALFEADFAKLRAEIADLGRRRISLFGESDSDAAEGGLNGVWLPILKTQDGQDVDVTPADLDAIVSNYADPAAPKAPVFFGPANEKSQRYGTVDAVKRVGNMLHGKFSGIDSRIEQLHREGALRRHVQIARGPNGHSLKNVSFLRPGPGVGGLIDDHLSGSLDEALKQRAAPQNVRFVIDVTSDSEKLSALAYEVAAVAGVSFGEALRTASRQHPDLCEGLRGTAINQRSQKLSDLAYERARATSTSFSESLSHVAREHPELI